ncbi:hypothetical protein F2Q69_00061855 [Brassica cretica]|uniref:Replication factor A C-terminal domain-containing protein n=1 Tax=Brassica cretica TaxID=69181 RepID=A0A8S9RAA3_BRACR|nr:hypothetical protein F2Q69_00061855 [Brassica cretica]
MVNPQLLLPELKAGQSKETVVKIQETGRAYADDIGLVDEQRVETELSGFDVKGVTILSRTPHHLCLLDSANIWTRKLQRGFSSITCASCNNNNTVGVLSCVSDETDTVGFVAFDGEMTKLTKRTFSRSRSTYGPRSETPTSLPQRLKDLVGSTLTLQLKLSPFNFSSKHQSFTISRVFDRNQRHHSQILLETTDVAKVVPANHTELQGCGVVEEGSGESSGSHDLIYRGGVKAESAEL